MYDPGSDTDLGKISVKNILKEMRICLNPHLSMDWVLDEMKLIEMVTDSKVKFQRVHLVIHHFG